MLPIIRIAARNADLGDGMTVRRALPSRQQRLVGAWCFLDHAGPVEFAPNSGMHVGPHPHIGLQTFTWMIEGEVLHRDSLGYEQIIRPGQVNLMTAGRGIVHSEDCVLDGGRLHAAQLWIALPEAERFRAPDFRNYADLPVIEQDGFRITVLAGTAGGKTSPVAVYSPLLGLDLVTRSEAATTLTLQPEFEHAALVLRGEASIAGETLLPGTLLYLGTGRHSLSVQCADATQILLLGGEPFGEEILLWWNFVGRTQDDMEQALSDWNNDAPRFGTIAGAQTPRLEAPTLASVKLKAR